MENKEVKEKNKPGIKAIVPWAVFVLSLCVAVFYVVISLVTHGWAWTWLIWVCYAAYRFFEGKRTA